MKLTSILIILLFAFTMAACGGGGGSSRVPDTEMPTPEDVTPSVDLSDLSVPANDYMIAAGETMDVGEGETEVTLSCSAAAACSFTVDEDGMATPTTGEVTAALSAAAMQAIADREEADRQAEATAVTDEAERVAKAIGNDSANDLNAANQLIGAAATTAATANNVSIDGGEVAQLDPPVNLEADPPVANQFMMSDTQASLGVAGWTGSTHTREREDDMATDTIVVYTDIKGNTSQPYSAYYDGTTPPTTNDTDATNDADEPRIAWRGVTSVDTEGVLTLSATVGDAYKLISSDALPTGANEVVRFADDEDTGSLDERNFKGTFHGIQGTFICTGAVGECRAINKDGKLNELTAPDGATWTFTPASSVNRDRTRVAGVLRDLDYIDFGYWLEATDGTSGMSYEVHPFVIGSDPVTVALVPANVRGSATYEGPATGLYMQKSVNDDGSVSPLHSGQFTASASLTAYFGQTTAEDTGGAGQFAANLESTISGTVSSFMDYEGNALPATWSVELKQASLAIDLAEGVFDGLTAGSGTSGTWKGQFFGPVTGDNPATPDVETNFDLQPGSVGGTFDGHFTNGHVAGAFAATKQ